MSTYNPRDNSPIKKPEAKVCPTCGHTLAPDAVQLNNHMNLYINDVSGREIAFNSNEKYVKIGEATFRRKDIIPAKDPAKEEVTTPAAKATTTTPPATPSAPAKPAAPAATPAQQEVK